MFHKQTIKSRRENKEYILKILKNIGIHGKNSRCDGWVMRATWSENPFITGIIIYSWFGYEDYCQFNWIINENIAAFSECF